MWLCIAVVTGAFFGGVTVGLYQRHVYRTKITEMELTYKKMPDDLSRSFDALLILKDIGILEALRDGRTNSVIELTEVDLISTIERLCEDGQIDTLLSNSNDIRTFKKVAHYLERYPGVRPSPTVKDVLRKVRETE